MFVNIMNYYIQTHLPLFAQPRDWVECVAKNLLLFSDFSMDITLPCAVWGLAELKLRSHIVLLLAIFN